jgi:hypothetical protein
MTPLKSICVYCGSAFGANPKHRAIAQRFGELLGRNGIDLVYGGGRVGLMGVIADAALKNGSKVIGVIPEHLQSKEVGHRGISELRIVPNMHERRTHVPAFRPSSSARRPAPDETRKITWRQLRLHQTNHAIGQRRVVGAVRAAQRTHRRTGFAGPRWPVHYHRRRGGYSALRLRPRAGVPDDVKRL